ncbi:2TM domain-containing protein [Tenacibaculum sp. MAR_2009_124]|uniref:2TM domain-containing protein n=1 Tax=Tenacibaculum sp. MAR_2009_124 TaxID=1250059 RepID=UPI000894CC47|nr:2TM domain-containing protein [Tenacibaculum sp. MAR_2009_124]SEB53165.1 2TM domain-containing protein [Tenacibaculum sp. MAR_2009_124]
MENKYIEEKKYLDAKKRIKQIKAFYVHVAVNIVSLAVIVFINLKFSPEFHWFWFAAVGIFLATFFHWLGVFGANVIGLGKEWEEKKIKEYMEKNK